MSGGADSVVMTHLFKNSDFDLAIAHVNFQLRGEESDGDEQFVRELSLKLSLPVFVKSIDTKAYALSRHLSTQVAARDIRYGFFDELCAKHGYTRVAIAHHADDQTETFFINLMRSSGLRGLGGIPLRRDSIIRPLLFATRDQIEQYAHEHGLGFRTDSSNESDAYLRNNIRHHLIPQLQETLPGFSVALAATMNHLKDSEALIQQVIAEKRSALFIEKENDIRIPVEDLKKLRPLKTWLFYLLSEFEFNAETIQSSAEAILHSASGKQFHSQNYRMVVDRAEVIITPIQQATELNAIEIGEEATEIVFPMHMNFKVIEKPTKLNLRVSDDTALFDRDKLLFPLLLRPWQRGDRFVPFGMNGSKLVSDFLIDQKISVVDKERIFVLVSGDKIIWVVGYRVGSYAAVVRGTKNILQVKT